MGKKLRSRKKIREKNTKKLFACLLSLAMLPANGVTAFAAQKQTMSQQSNAEVKTQADDSKESKVTFAKDSLQLKIGHFNKCYFEGIKRTDISELSIGFYGESGENVDAKFQTYDWDDDDNNQGAFYILYGINPGTHYIGANITTKDGEEIEVPKTAVQVEKAEDDIVPLASYDLYEAIKRELGNKLKNDDCITKDEIKRIKELDVSYQNVRDLQGLDCAVNCTDLNLTDNSSLENIDPLKSLTKLQYLDLSNTSVKDIHCLKGVKDQLKQINLTNTEVPVKDRFDFIKNQTINIEEGTKKAATIEPKGILEDTDECTISGNNITVKKQDGAVVLDASNAKAGESQILTITNEKDPDAKVMIPVKVTEATSQRPKFASESISVNIGQFKKMKFENVTDDMAIYFKSKDKSIVRTIQNEKLYEPRNKGKTQVEAEFETKDGTIYTSSIEITVNENEKNVVPVKSWVIYTWLRDKNDDYVDANGDYKITTDEIKNVSSVSLNDDWEEYKITAEDLSGIDQAVNCEEFSLYRCYDMKFDAVQSLIGKLPNLKRLNLERHPITQDQIDSLVKEENVKRLQSLSIYSCSESQDEDYFESVSGFKSIDVSGLTKLSSFTLGNMEDVKTVTGLEKLTDLKKLSLRYMSGLNDFSQIKNLENLEDLDLYDTKIDSVESIKDLKKLNKIDLGGTHIEAKDRLSLIRTKKIELEEGERRAYSIYPIGVIDEWDDKVTLDADSSFIDKYNEYSPYGLEAKKNSAGKTGTLTISNDGKTYATIPISVVSEKEETPNFANKEQTIPIGYTGEVKFKNIDKLDYVNFNIVDDDGDDENDGEDILEIRRDYRSDKYHFIPKKAGKVNVIAEINVKDGQSYQRTMTVTVTDTPEGYLPIKNRSIYRALVDDDGQSVDTNKDDMIDTTEIQKVTKILATYSNVDNNDFAYLSQAVNCKKMDISDNRGITDLSFIGSFPKLTEINLDGNEKISDYAELIKHKAQFDKIILPAGALDATRKDLITTDNISLDKGQTVAKAIKPEGLLKDTDKVSVEDDNIAEAKIVTEYDEDGFALGSHLEVQGKSHGTTTLEIHMGSETKTINVKVTDAESLKAKFDQTSTTMQLGTFKKYKFENVESSDIQSVKFTCDGNAVEMVDNKDGTYTPVAKNEGPSKVSAEITLKDGNVKEVKEATFTVTKADANTVVIKDYDLYKGMLNNGKSADVDQNGMISKDEIKNVDEIVVQNSNITDLTGVEEAINCKKVDFTNDGQLKDIKALGNLKELTSVILKSTAVNDINVLNNLINLKNVELRDNNVSEKDQLALLKLNDVSMTEGESRTQEITPSGIVGDTTKVDVADTNVATAQISNGSLIITGKAGGTTTVSIYNDDKASAKTITVNVAKKPQEPTTEEPTKPKPQVVKVSKITLSAPVTNVAPGKKVKIKATVTPTKAANKAVTWSTSNKKLATVDKNGTVTFNKKAGGKSVTITATAKDGSKKKSSIKFKVAKGEVKKITITGKKTLNVGKTLTLKAKVTATKGANKKLKWTSSNTKYATVSSSGKVKALKAGKKKTVTITAVATDGTGKKATIKIKIK